MINKQILKKAINKALRNGWQEDITLDNTIKTEFALRDCECFIFSHDFAKAFWGIKKDCPDNFALNDHLHNDRCTMNELLAWQYHLQQMVLEKEPLKYIERFL